MIKQADKPGRVLVNVMGCERQSAALKQNVFPVFKASTYRYIIPATSKATDQLFRIAKF